MASSRTPLLLGLLWAWSLPYAAASQPERYRWQGFWLHPPRASDSYAYAIDGDVPSGKITDVYGDGVVWPEWTTEYVGLKPAESQSAYVEGADGGYQAGKVYVEYQVAYPALWQGTAESVIDLTPPGPYYDSALYQRQGSQTVGWAYHNIDGRHAAMWLNNDPAQFVDLHPNIADWSRAHATDGVRQGGRVAIPNIGQHAALWKGTAASFIDMGPPGQYTYGWIRGMASGTQVGEYVNLTKRAALWHDTPESMITMSPPWATSAALYATIGDMHVGYAAHPSGRGGAGIWYGDDPESFFDLHRFVPAQYADNGSTAFDIDTKDGNIYIAGTVNIQHVAHAFLWVGVPLDTGDGGGGPKSPGGLTKTRKP
ncbi:MAG: hypothetical protein IT431_08720 [Phycisphaerales bacterium]|nr:hypothetical protein [Phycisphaerales bacterium]